MESNVRYVNTIYRDGAASCLYDAKQCQGEGRLACPRTTNYANLEQTVQQMHRMKTSQALIHTIKGSVQQKNNMQTDRVKRILFLRLLLHSWRHSRPCWGQACTAACSPSTQQLPCWASSLALSSWFSFLPVWGMNIWKTGAHQCSENEY